MPQCHRCKHRFPAPPDEPDGHPCPECGWEPGLPVDRHTLGCPGGNCDCDVELVDDDATWVED